MAKKSRRVRRKDSQSKLSEAQLVQPTQASQAAQPAVEKPAAETTARSSEVDFKVEYQYVVSDLKRLLILAAATFLGLVALSFVL